MTLREQIEAKAREAGEEALAHKPNLDALAPDGEAKGIELNEWAPVVGQAADAATTLIAVSGGAVEGNQMMERLVKQPWAWLLVKAGIAAGMNRVIDARNDAAGRLRLSGQVDAAEAMDRSTRKLAWALTMLGAGPALSNARVIMQQRRGR